MSAVHRKLRLLGHDVTVFTSTVNQTHMMPPDCLECTSTCRFKKKFLSFHACNHPMRRGGKKRVHLSLYRMNFSFCGQSSGKWLRLGRRRNSGGGGGRRGWGGEEGSVFRRSDQNFQGKNVLKVLTHQTIREAMRINDLKKQIFRWRIFPVHTEHEANMHRKSSRLHLQVTMSWRSLH